MRGSTGAGSSGQTALPSPHTREHEKDDEIPGEGARGVFIFGILGEMKGRGKGGKLKHTRGEKVALAYTMLVGK